MRHLMARATAVVAPSDYLRRELAVVRADIEVIPNVIEVDPATVSSERASRSSLLWMRTFEPTYDPEMAIDVVAHLRARGHDARLTMAGQDQGALERTRAHADTAKVADYVSFPGFLDRAEKTKAFAEHAIFINTTRVDNAPVTLFEAAAAGLPIVTTDAGGISTLFEHEVNALVVPVGDVDAMADAVGRLVDDPDLVAHLVQNARELALSATWERVKPRWLSVLTAAMAT
jgi:glycosyltransferase involved in cell wall biosynthesis